MSPAPATVTVSYQVNRDDMADRGRIGAFVLHSRHDSGELTAPARAAFLSRFESEVDPDGLLSPEERARRAEYARKAYFARLARASAKARREKKGGAA